MLKTYLYIPEELDKKIVITTRLQKKSKATVMRQALEKGLDVIQKENSASLEVLFKIAKLGKKYKLSGPRDSSLKMDEYLWEKEWKNE